MRYDWFVLRMVSFAFTVTILSPSHGGGPDKEDPQNRQAGRQYFETHIRPLLIDHCYECHSSKRDRREGGLLLDRPQGWSVGGQQGPAVVPGNADASLLIQAVRYDDTNLQMPPDAPLPKPLIAHLERWVSIGAPSPHPDAKIDIRPRENPADPKTGKSHWAYRPIADHQPPQVSVTDWPRSTIDSFVLARMESGGLAPVPDAEPRDLVRRIYFVLTGLPPTAEQVDSFLRDDRPDALVRLVDQLLGSPQFGQHWGRHWLDLARYADSNGLDENFLFREAWRYRNWVIDAINADMPYDRFILEQIAGDLLPYDSIAQRDRQRIAAGFLVLGPKVLLGNDPQRQRMEIADEQLDTIGRAILGQTLGCARCHDHKFDPLPTSDYYALAGIMTSTQVVEQRYMLGQQRVMERLVGLGTGGNQSDEAYEQYYREQPETKARRTRVKSALQLLRDGDFAGLRKLVAEHADSLAVGASSDQIPIAQRIQAQETLLAELDRILAAPPPIPPRAMIPADVDSPGDERIRLAGQFDRLGRQVPRGFLSVLCNTEFSIDVTSSGRVELSRWLIDPHGAGPLTARVLANRVWHHVMGCGIVRTVDNFGRTGEAASHPALLDHLAGQLVESQWSIKQLVRSIVLSRTFALSSAHHSAAHQVDPDNRLLWRAHRRRLGAESIRDAMLMAAGQLDLTPLESSVWYLGDQATAVGANKNRRRTDFPCRSVYLPVIRNDLPEIFEVLDFADPHITTGVRPETTVATRGLYFLNAKRVMDAAEAAARRLLSDSGHDPPATLATRAYQLILGKPPSDEARHELVAFAREVEKQLVSAGHQDAQLKAWALVCQALFASSRFQILE